MNIETFELPWPPSANHYWFIVACKGGGRKVLGKKGKEFREQIKQLIGERDPRMGKLYISIDAFPPDRRKRDLDNLLKATLDALEAANVYEDDNQIDSIRIDRQNPRPGGYLWITIGDLDE